MELGHTGISKCRNSSYKTWKLATSLPLICFTETLSLDPVYIDPCVLLETQCSAALCLNDLALDCQDWKRDRTDTPLKSSLIDNIWCVFCSDRDSTAPHPQQSALTVTYLYHQKHFPFFTILETSLSYSKKHMADPSTLSSLLQHFTYMMAALPFPICLLWTEQNILLSVSLCTSCFLFSPYCSLSDAHPLEKVSRIPLEVLLLFNRV